jgi:hypothetical protein
MSRRRQLIDALQGVDNTWVTNIVLNNIPAIMINNDYIRSICVAANSALLECYMNNQDALNQVNISKNK